MVDGTGSRGSMSLWSKCWCVVDGLRNWLMRVEVSDHATILVLVYNGQCVHAHS